MGVEEHIEPREPRFNCARDLLVSNEKGDRNVIDRCSADFALTYDGLDIYLLHNYLILLEATPGIEPGYTVLQAHQGVFMGIFSN